MAAINRWSKSSASRSRKRRSKDRLSACSRLMGRWMSWVELPSECAFKHRRMCMRPLAEAWPRQLRIRKVNGEFRSSKQPFFHYDTGNRGFVNVISISFSVNSHSLSLNSNVVNNSLLITAAPIRGNLNDYISMFTASPNVLGRAFLRITFSSPSCLKLSWSSLEHRFSDVAIWLLNSACRVFPSVVVVQWTSFFHSFTKITGKILLGILYTHICLKRVHLIFMMSRVLVQRLTEKFSSVFQENVDLGKVDVKRESLPSHHPFDHVFLNGFYKFFVITSQLNYFTSFYRPLHTGF